MATTTNERQRYLKPTTQHLHYQHYKHIETIIQRNNKQIQSTNTNKLQKMTPNHPKLHNTKSTPMQRATNPNRKKRHETMYATAETSTKNTQTPENPKISTIATKITTLTLPNNNKTQIYPTTHLPNSYQIAIEKTKRKTNKQKLSNNPDKTQ